MSHPIHAIEPVTKHEVTREASAQIAALTAKQEAALRFAKFDADIAWTVGNVIRDTFIAARKAGKHAADSGIVIHIETFTGHVLFSCAIGTPPTVGPDNWCVEVGGECRLESAELVSCLCDMPPILRWLYAGARNLLWRSPGDCSPYRRPLGCRLVCS